MSNNNPGNITSNPNEGRSESKLPGFLRIVSLAVLVIGAIGSLGFMFSASQHTPRLLLFIFIIWVLSPFAALLWGIIASKRWSVLTQVSLYCVTIIVGLVSLALYSKLVDVRPAGSANAFLFVAVPPVSLAFITIIVGIAALLSRRLPHSKE